MHELSIAVSMIERITEESEIRGGLHVEAVHLKLGVFSGVDKDALGFAYELATEGTPLQGSRLLIDPIPLVIYCPGCRKERAPVSLTELACPECLAPAQEIITGREIEVVSLEVAA